jgi:hypothetical protein
MIKNTGIMTRMRYFSNVGTVNPYRLITMAREGNLSYTLFYSYYSICS